MAKFHGPIGYMENVETAPGVYTEVVTEHIHSGDILRNSRSTEPGIGLNDDMRLSNQISIVADQFAANNYQNMRYVTLDGNRWKIIKMEVQRPRLILTIGGLYNG